MRPSLRRLHIVGALYLLALLCAAIAAPKFFPIQQATLIVTTTNDSGPGSLRQALADANNGDTIQFDPALNGQTISLTSGELVINKDISISGPGPSLLAVSRSGTSQFRIFHALSGHTVVVEGLTITGGDVHNNVLGCGGGILNDGATSTINNCTISGNRGFDGGGICSDDGSLTIAHSSIDSNQAGSGSSGGSGGGIYHRGGSLELIQSTVTNNAGINYGGGVMSAGGTITIIDSTIRSNTTLLGGGIEIGGFFGGTGDVRNSTISGNTAQVGGGIGTSSGAGLTISNSTVSGNFANIQGGAISNSDALTITYSTISGNGTNGSAGVIFNGSSGTFEVGNTILSSGANIFNNGGGTITSHGYNLSSDNGDGFLTGPGDQINTNPMLGPLQNNGGPTFTHNLLTGSPAIDAGDPNFTPPPLYDQRGFGYARVFNGRLDIGSLEVQPAFTPSPTPTATSTATATATPTATATATATPPCALIEGFGDITTLPGAGWVLTNHSAPVGTTNWFQGNSTVFPAQLGAATSYIGANFNNTTGANTISNWLLTPPLPLRNGETMTFWTRTVDAPAFPDRLQVRMSTHGASVNVGTSATDVGDFATLLLDINPTYTTTGYPSVWMQFTVTVSGVPTLTDGRLAFRYFVENGGPTGANSDYIGIDTVIYNTCGDPFPTPSPTATATATATSTATPTPTATATPCGAIFFSENFDSLPAGTPGPCWYISNVDPDTPPNCALTPDNDGVTCCVYDFTGIQIPTATSVVRFRNNFDTEFGSGSYCDGGVLEVSSPNISGGDFLDITDSHVGGSFVTGGYTVEMNANCGTPLAERMAWAGNSNGYIDTVINLGPNLVGQTITLRFRFCSDEAVAAPGWRIDTIVATDGVCPTPTPSPTPTPGSPTPTPTPTPSASPVPARPLNLSTRMLVLTGDSVGIGGFIITGSGPKDVLLRGIGPSLANFGIFDPLADPTLELRGSDGSLIWANDNWRDSQEAEITATGLAPFNNLESAILATVNPGTYTTIVRGKNNSSGVGLVEVYDLGPATSKLANISTRAFVSTGDDVVFGGFILSGGDNTHILIRGIGPSLSGFGIIGTLADPTLQLYDNYGPLLASNDNCEGSTLPPTDPLEACIETWLPPGTYTAILRGKNGGTGIGLVEIYNLQ